jgi:hypothetical protein
MRRIQVSPIENIKFIHNPDWKESFWSVTCAGEQRHRIWKATGIAFTLAGASLAAGPLLPLGLPISVAFGIIAVPMVIRWFRTGERRKERQKPPKVRHLIERMLLAASSGRQVDGIWIGADFAPEHLSRVERALLLVKQHSPLHYSRIIRDLERIWIVLLPYGLAAYYHSLKACLLDERFVADSATSVEQIASTIVHEATHARLERYGIGYDEDQRARIEGICFRRELALAVRLPDSARLQQEIAGYLDWYLNPANADYLRDAAFIERHKKHKEMAKYLIIEMAKYLIIEMAKSLRSIIGRARRLFRVASRAGCSGQCKIGGRRRLSGRSAIYLRKPAVDLSDVVRQPCTVITGASQ